MSTDTLTA